MDKFHNIAKEIFELIKINKLNEIYIPSSAFLEYELLLKSQGIEEIEILKDIANFQNIENINEFPLDSSIIVKAIRLTEKYNLTYFDSLHCASAINLDAIIISSDKDFEKIVQLKVINPKDLIQSEKI